MKSDLLDSPRFLPLLTLVWAAFVGSIPCASLAADFNHDFRSGSFDFKQFRYEGPDAGKYIKPEASGLHWKFSPGKAPERPVGVYWNSRVSGDFTVTVRYEILEATAPKTGPGVGAELYLMLDGPGKDGIALSRLELPDGTAAMKFVHLATDQMTGKRQTSASRTVATLPSSLRGELRLSRTGPELVASWAEGENSEFQSLIQTVVPMTDLQMARFAGVTGGDSNAQLDMRLLEYRLGEPDRSPLGIAESPILPKPSEDNQQSPSATVPTTAPTASPDSGNHSWWVAGLGAALLGAALGTALWSRRRSPDRVASSKATFLCSFRCPNCAMKLKVAADKAGGRVKCPHCETSVLVPRETTSP